MDFLTKVDDNVCQLKSWNNIFYNSNGNYRKYYIRTYGCQMNEHDSERMAFLLESAGYYRTNIQNEADLILYNTCMIRENAEVKVYGNLGHLKPLKESNKELMIGLCGCMMQHENIRKLIKEKYKQVDFVFGTNNINELPILINSKLQNKDTVISIHESMEIVENTNKVVYQDPSRAYVNIMYGCNNFCTFCVVPSVRGREISRDPNSIINEIEQIVDDGYKEIMLLGQNVNSYGKTLDFKYSFSMLLDKISDIKGLERIRFMTSHPRDCSSDLIDIMASKKNICSQIHLPVQSGSTKVLKMMNRHYDREHYINLIDSIRNKIPNIAISTDIIVGFPDETEQDFLDTMSLIDYVKYDQGFMFLYSPRPLTAAKRMKNQVPHEIKKERFQRLLDGMYKNFNMNNKNCIGKIENVYIEGTSRGNSQTMSGRTESFRLVHLPLNTNLIGKIVPVKIIGSNTFSLFGELINK